MLDQMVRWLKPRPKSPDDPHLVPGADSPLPTHPLEELAEIASIYVLQIPLDDKCRLVSAVLDRAGEADTVTLREPVDGGDRLRLVASHGDQPVNVDLLTSAAGHCLTTVDSFLTSSPVAING